MRSLLELFTPRNSAANAPHSCPSQPIVVDREHILEMLDQQEAMALLETMDQRVQLVLMALVLAQAIQVKQVLLEMQVQMVIQV